MSKELVISSNRHDTKVAILEEDQLVEIYFQHANEYSLAGSIHKGRVTRVLPGMQSAFVDLGLERDTFLYVSDFFEEHGEDFDRVGDEKPSRSSRPESVRVQTVDVQPAVPVVDLETASERAVVEAPLGERPIERTATEAADRERRGRRSRRRRSRGGGFPESKYAAVPSEEAEEPESSEATHVVQAPIQEADDMILLPGESLAKYRNQPAGEENPESGGFEASSAGESTEEALSSTGSSFPEAGFAAPEMFLAPFEAAASEESEERREQLLADTAEQTGSAIASVAIAEPDEFVVPIAEIDIDRIIPIADDDGTDDSEVPVEEPETEQPRIEEPDPEQPDPERPDIDEPEPEPSSAAVTEPEATEPLTASVREGGGNRFQHRGARRMRRRRGGDQPARTPAAMPEPAPEPPSESQITHGTDRPPLPSIADLLREGQEIIVQIAKEPLGQKGARITSHIALPGRYVVYMPTLEHLGVSRKIASDEERQRLKKVLQASRLGMTGGFIVRTAGEGHTEEEIAADMGYLYNLWLDIRQKAEKKPAPVLLHHDLDIVQRILRDQLNDMFKAIWCDNEEVYESILRFMQRFQPSLVGRVKMYTRPMPIFDAFSVSQEIEKALRPKVWLKSGGYIVINQTEALVAIDVNTGKYVGKSNRLEDTITKTNTEAVKEIVRQIRLRDLGGIIVVDFIDMDERKNRQKVMQALEETMRADRAPYKILQFNDFGLVAITRKRVKQSLERSLCVPCPTCEGASYVKSIATVVGEMLQEAMKVRSLVEGKNVVVRAFPEVAKYLKSNTNTYLEEMEEILGRPVLVTSDPLLHPEKFDIAW